MGFSVRAIKTPKINFETSLESLFSSLAPLKERSIVAVTSKVVSIIEGAFVPKNQNKRELVRQEADAYLDEGSSVQLTIKNNLLIPNAGIDESNIEGENYVLYPQDVFKSAERIWDFLKKRDHLTYLGILLTDSSTLPLRRGTVGRCLSWCGFQPIYSYKGKKDCFGRSLKISNKNIIDSLAAMSVFAMGEGAEQTPLALITGLENLIEFNLTPPNEEDKASVMIPLEDDIYASFFSEKNWKGNGI